MIEIMMSTQIEAIAIAVAAALKDHKEPAVFGMNEMTLKIWPWGPNPDYAIKVDEGSKGKWRWSLVFQGDTVALSPVKGWDTAEEARDSLPQGAGPTSARSHRPMRTGSRKTRMTLWGMTNDGGIESRRRFDYRNHARLAGRPAGRRSLFKKGS